ALEARRAYNPTFDTEEGRSALVQEYAARAARLDPVDLPDLQILIEEGKAAQQELIERNTPLIFMVAARLRTARLSPWDVRLSAGYEGLVQAVRGFDARLGFEFSSYAVQMIGGVMMRASMRELGERLNTSAKIAERIIKMHRVESVLIQELRRPPLDDEIAQRMGIKRASTIEGYKRILGMSYTQSLNAEVGSRSKNEIITARDTTEADAEAAEALNATLQQVFEAVELSDDEQQVLCGLFGVTPYTEPWPEAELASQLHKTEREIKKLFKSAQGKLLQSPQAAKILHLHLKPPTA
ncbi:MAG: sigma-70 family RNA polymerase sigma factor, partial [Patescibacteria group bacterium]